MKKRSSMALNFKKIDTSTEKKVCEVKKTVKVVEEEVCETENCNRLCGKIHKEDKVLAMCIRMPNQFNPLPNSVKRRKRTDAKPNQAFFQHMLSPR